MKNGKYIEDGTERWFKDNKYHRLDGPAIIRRDGTEEWYKDGERHRLDDPAVIRSDGTKEYWINNLLHRLDGPAYISSTGTENWFVDNKLHRLNGPAVIYSTNGDEFWFINGIEIFPQKDLIEIPETEEEKLKVINQFKFIEINKKYVLINEWLKKDKRFYNKYKVLFE
jgi:hypothetical protein